jgi:Lar family restriction alleviation protein
MTEIKECPWCGGAARLDHNTVGREYWEGYCSTCDYAAQDRPTKAEAIAAWNTRAAPDIAGLVEALEAYSEDADCDLCERPVSSGELARQALAKFRSE